MKRFSITIASILFFLISVSGVHGAAFEISGGTESNVTTDTAQTITGKKTFSDNTKQCFGDGDDSCLYWDGTRHINEQAPIAPGEWRYRTSSDGGTINKITVYAPNGAQVATIQSSDGDGPRMGAESNSDAVFISNDINRGAFDKTGYFYFFVDADTIADSGDGNPATATLTPTSSYVEITCNDANTCDITMGETGTAEGEIVHIVNVSTNSVDFADSSGVLELDGGVTIELGQYQSASFLYDGSRWVEASRPYANSKPTAINFIIDGGGNIITALEEKGHVEVPFDCTISRVTMLANTSGSIQVDIWKDTYASFPPTDGDSITASAVPAISSDTDSQDSTLTGWTTSVSAGDVLAYYVDSVEGIHRVTVSAKCDRT